MNLWWELVGLMSEVNLSEEDDQIVWAYSSAGKFSVQSLYAVVNFRGITPVFVSSVWKLVIPSRVQFFLWLLSKNKLLTRDNLAKRRNVMILHVYSVLRMSLLFIYSLTATLLD